MPEDMPFAKLILFFLQEAKRIDMGNFGSVVASAGKYTARVVSSFCLYYISNSFVKHKKCILDLLDRVLIESDHKRFFAFWLAGSLKVFD
jgi:hypothetical protein